MKEFEKINSILDKIEELVEDGEFEITEDDCNQLYHEAVKELNELSIQFDTSFDYVGDVPNQMDKALMDVQKRFKTLKKQFETPEEFIDGIRSMMFPNEDDEIDNYID